MKKGERIRLAGGYKKYYELYDAVTGQLLIPKKQQGRNEKCNCGSGLKYKKCCLNKTEEV